MPELEQWMDWAQEMPTLDALQELLRQGELDFHADQSWDYTIFDAGVVNDVLGAVGLHRTERTSAGSRSATGCGPPGLVVVWQPSLPETVISRGIDLLGLGKTDRDSHGSGQHRQCLG